MQGQVDTSHLSHSLGHREVGTGNPAPVGLKSYQGPKLVALQDGDGAKSRNLERNQALR